MSASSNPLSKIQISSHKAVCQRSNDNPNVFMFSYQKSVKVQLADKTTIRARTLDIVLNENPLQSSTTTNTLDLPTLTATSDKYKKDSFSQFQKITFNHNVRIKKGYRTVRADTVEIFPHKNICELRGNVIIRQRKKHKKHIPFVTRGDKAVLNLKTQQITLVGDEAKPISTIIRLSKHHTTSKINKA